ncbi:MAG TPA: hypothetical protein V6D48_22095 [Oculatellaceae cyanobacterium]
MTQIQIQLIVGIEELLLVVFSDRQGWKFRIANARGEVFGEREIFDTPEAAEYEGRSWINTAAGWG